MKEERIEGNVLVKEITTQTKNQSKKKETKKHKQG
jgi:hypothetical protein